MALTDPRVQGLLDASWTSMGPHSRTSQTAWHLLPNPFLLGPISVLHHWVRTWAILGVHLSSPTSATIPLNTPKPTAPALVHAYPFPARSCSSFLPGLWSPAIPALHILEGSAKANRTAATLLRTLPRSPRALKDRVRLWVFQAPGGLPCPPLPGPRTPPHNLDPALCA